MHRKRFTGLAIVMMGLILAGGAVDKATAAEDPGYVPVSADQAPGGGWQISLDRSAKRVERIEEGPGPDGSGRGRPVWIKEVRQELMGSQGTAGLAWADDNGNLIGHLTAGHVLEVPGHVRANDPTDAVIKERLSAVNYDGKKLEKPVTAVRTTAKADVAVISPAAKTVHPTITESYVSPDGKARTHEVTGHAKPGDIKKGQRVCHTGNNPTTLAEHRGLVCGTVDWVGDTENCTNEFNYHADDPMSTCKVYFKPEASGYLGGSGDSGSPVWMENPAGGVTVVGVFVATEGNQGIFEPTCAATELLGGRPYTVADAPQPAITGVGATISGTARPFSEITTCFDENWRTCGFSAADADGRWQRSVPGDLAPGEHSFQVGRTQRYFQPSDHEVFTK